MIAEIRRGVRFVSRRNPLAVVLVGVLAIAVSAGLSLLKPPLPRVHDEFSYLLAADTFAAGRLTNPSHPCRAYFETFHVLQEPSYASKYPPLQGIFLALGQAITGFPIVGAWLGVALGCAATCWMLQGWTRPRWALLGGVLAAFHHGIHGGISGWGSYYSWSQSFWGGGPAMLGGALALGAWVRWERRPTPRLGIIFGVGLAVLANTRPFEGSLVSLAIVALIVRRGALSKRDLIACLSALVVLGATAIFMAEYNREVTGSVTTLPYSLYESSYSPAPIFTVFQSTRPTPHYRHDVLRHFFVDWCNEQVDVQKTLAGWWRHQRERMLWIKCFFVGPLVLPLLLLPWTLGARLNRIAFCVMIMILGAHLLTIGILPHYAAPVSPCFFLLVVESMRRLGTVRFQNVHIGKVLNRLTCLFVVGNLVFIANARVTEEPGWEASRANIELALKARKGKHLIVVRYAPEHDFHHEWVTNRADVDRAEVVWARESSAMTVLLDYFHDRTIWVLDADSSVPSLKTYPGLSPTKP